MSDKRWASNLVSKINRSHASKTNEIELHLERKSAEKLKNHDYRGAIKALRRAEKYISN